MLSSFPNVPSGNLDFSDASFRNTPKSASYQPKLFKTLMLHPAFSLICAKSSSETHKIGFGSPDSPGGKASDPILTILQTQRNLTYLQHVLKFKDSSFGSYP